MLKITFRANSLWAWFKPVFRTTVIIFAITSFWSSVRSSYSEAESESLSESISNYAQILSWLLINYYPNPDLKIFCDVSFLPWELLIFGSQDLDRGCAFQAYFYEYQNYSLRAITYDIYETIRRFQKPSGSSMPSLLSRKRFQSAEYRDLIGFCSSIRYDKSHQTHWHLPDQQ